MKRRELLKAFALLAGSGLAADPLKAAKGSVFGTATPELTPKRVLRIAHLTDMHISADKRSLEGMQACFHYIQSMPEPPDIIFSGGDTIEDGLYATRSKVRNQWGAWRGVLQAENSLPIKYCLGNHDIWGLYNPAKDAMYGKNFALEMMHTDKVYQSFDLAGWHFIFLDSTQKKRNGLWYTAKLDEEQMDWLRKDLEQTPADKPVLVLSHIPILCANVFMDDMKVRNGKFSIPGSWMHTDVKEIVGLFSAHPNVKLCLSGHIHMQDTVRYNDISFYCNGAVSGDWWKNDTYKGTKAGFALVDLYNDGSHTNTYMSYR